MADFHLYWDCTASSKRCQVLLGQFFFRLEPILEVVAQNPAVLAMNFVGPAQQILDRSRILHEAVQVRSLQFPFVVDLPASEHVQESLHIGLSCVRLFKLGSRLVRNIAFHGQRRTIRAARATGAGGLELENKAGRGLGRMSGHIRIQRRQTEVGPVIDEASVLEAHGQMSD